MCVLYLECIKMYCTTPYFVSLLYMYMWNLCTVYHCSIVNNIGMSLHVHVQYMYIISGMCTMLAPTDYQTEWTKLSY